MEEEKELVEIKPEPELAIVIVVYNNPNLIITQIECIQKFCKDENYDIIVIDNSDDPQVVDSIRYHSTQRGCKYLKTQASSHNDSHSHAFACNFAYYTFKDNYKYFFFSDHDSFPVKDFSVKEILKDKIIAGLHQQRPAKEYFWAGCVMWDNEKIDKTLIDFSPNSQLKLDTGGNFYKVIEKHSKDNCVFFDEIHCQNPYFNKSFYNFYSMIHNGTFMHFLNSSNWANANDNQERINSLLNILHNKIEHNNG